jgi:hypothetical protein
MMSHLGGLGMGELLGFVLAAAAGAAQDGALTIPAQTRLEVRLDHSVSNTASSPGVGVGVTVIAPVLSGGRVAIPAGRTLRGTVEETGSLTDKRPRLLLAFGDLADGRGGSVAIRARLSDIDARQALDGEGRLIGPPPMKGQPSQPEERLALAADLNPFALGLMDVSKRQVHAVITLEKGVEMTLALVSAASLPPPPLAGPHDLRWLARAQPLAIAAEAAPEASEPTNVLLVGARDRVERALDEAGWARAGGGRLGPATDAFLKLVVSTGYKVAFAPRLDGQPPDLVFEKRVNSLARGRLLRLWSQPQEFEGAPVWTGSVVRQSALDVRKDTKRLVPRLHARPDNERARLVDDLRLVGRAERVEIVERPEAPREARSAAGDPLETDGRIAAIVVR